MDNAFEQDLKLDMLKYDGSHPRHLVAIQRAASHYHKLANQAMLKDKEEQTMHKKDQQAQDTYFSWAYRILSDKATAPITFLRRIQVGPKGEAPGTFATNHSELDAILQQAWGAFTMVSPNPYRMLPGNTSTSIHTCFSKLKRYRWTT